MSRSNAPTLGQEEFDNPSSDFNSALFKLLNIVAVTPGSDITFCSQKSEIIWGRDGNDTLLGFDPNTNTPGQWKIDVFIGDLVEQQITGEGTPRDWNNRFIFGDWKQPYYANGDPGIFGLNDFALVTDFNPAMDIIQLHGSPQDYQLVDVGFGEALLQQKETGSDVIGFLLGNSNLSLESNYFQFEGNTPPKGPVIPQTQQLGTAGIDFSANSATDSMGNVYLAGSTSGSLGGLNAGSSDAWVAKYDSDGNQVWLRQFGTPGNDITINMTTDKQGNSYLTGMTTGDSEATSQGNTDAWMVKYDSEGNQVWLQHFNPGLFNDSCNVDDNGNIYLSGVQIQQGSGVLTIRDDPWVAKYDSNGNQQWFQNFGTSDLDEAYGVAVSSDGNVYSTGWTRGNLGGLNPGLYDAWIAKHDKNGQLQWIKQFGTKDYEYAWSVDTDSQGNVYATGWTLGDLGGKNAGSYDAFLAKYDSQGNQQWIKQFGTPGDDEAYRINIDSNNNIFLTGQTNNSLGGSNAGSYDTWVAKFDTNGNQVWTKQLGTPEFDQGLGISSDSVGHLYVTGITEGSLGAINAGSEDVWVAKLDAENGTLQDFTAGTPECVVGNDTLIGGDNAGILSGNFNNDILNEGMDASLRSVGGEDLDSVALSPFPTTDAVTSSITGVAQSVAGAGETLMMDDSLTGSVSSTSLPTLSRMIT